MILNDNSPFYCFAVWYLVEAGNGMRLQGMIAVMRRFGSLIE